MDDVELYDHYYKDVVDVLLPYVRVKDRKIKIFLPKETLLMEYPMIFTDTPEENIVILLNNLNEFRQDTKPVLVDKTGQVEVGILDMLAQFM